MKISRQYHEYIAAQKWTGRTLQSIADEFGVTRQRIYQIVKKHPKGLMMMLREDLKALTDRVIAERHDVKQATVNNIACGKTWKRI